MSGMRETPPADLDQALIDLEADALTPSAFERVARWRRACGDAESAAEWQTWSLLPPEQADLRTALAECWRRLGRFDRAARLLNAQAPSWHQLAMLSQERRVDDKPHARHRRLSPLSDASRFSPAPPGPHNETALNRNYGGSERSNQDGPLLYATQKSRRAPEAQGVTSSFPSQTSRHD